MKEIKAGAKGDQREALNDSNGWNVLNHAIRRRALTPR